MHRITYERLDEQGNVLDTKVWNIPSGCAVSFTEERPVQYTRMVGKDHPTGSHTGPTTLRISALLDPKVRWTPYEEGKL